MLALSTSLRTKLNSIFDEMIEEWGKTCVLVYPPKLIVNGSGGNFRASGNKQTKVPANSPLSNGEGYKEQEITEEIRMSVVTDPRNFYVKFPANVQIPDGMIQTKGFIADLDKVMQATHLIVEPATLIGIKWKYSKYSEPKDIYNVITDRYFYVNWIRSS